MDRRKGRETDGQRLRDRKRQRQREKRREDILKKKRRREKEKKALLKEPSKITETKIYKKNEILSSEGWCDTWPEEARSDSSKMICSLKSSGSSVIYQE